MYLCGFIQPSLEHRGLQALSELKTLAKNVVRHLIARLLLAALEGREARVHYFRLTIALVIAFFFFLISYLLLLSFLIFFLARWAMEEWEWILLVLAILHAVGAIVCVHIFARYMHKPVFEATLAEVGRDIKKLRLFAE